MAVKKYGFPKYVGGGGGGDNRRYPYKLSILLKSTLNNLFTVILMSGQP